MRIEMVKKPYTSPISMPDRKETPMVVSRIITTLGCSTAWQ